MTENTKTKLTPDTSGIGWASLAAIVACAACCAIPLFAAAGIGGAGAATLARIGGRGSELVVGAVVFVAVLGLMVARARAKANVGCGTACAADGTCCGRRGLARDA